MALKCTANGEEETFFPDKSEEKPITKEDIFIFDAQSNKLMDKSYAPIEAEIDDKRIVVKTKAEDINAIDKSGSTSEYFFAFDRRAPRIISTNRKSCGHKNATMEAAAQENIISNIDEFL